MPGADQYRVNDFIDVIPGTGGIITKIAAKVGCDWHTAKKYIERHPTVKAAYNDECEKVLDAAESVVIKKITEDDEQTAKWYLTMKGGERGYAPKRRIAHDVKIQDVDSAIERELEKLADRRKVADASTAPKTE